MTYEADDRSIQASRPVELYRFTNAAGGLTYYTSEAEDVSWDAITWLARTISRGQLVIGPLTGSLEMPVTISRDDAMVVAYCGVGVAPQKFALTIFRLQRVSDEIEQIWSGFVTSCDLNDTTAQFMVTRPDYDLDAVVPSVVATRLCQATLFDARCGKNRDDFDFETTISAISGSDVTLASDGGFTDTLPFGEILHIATGERRSITSQTGTAIEILTRFPTTVAIGNAVRVWRGCDKLIATCRDDFNNVTNFRGMPHMSTWNAFFYDSRHKGI